MEYIKISIKEDFIRLDSDTAIGALANYVSDESVTKFQPMNVNFGIIKPLEKRVKGGKSARNSALSERALEIVEAVAKEYFNEIDN